MATSDSSVSALLAALFMLFTLIISFSIVVKADNILTIVNNCPFSLWPAIQPNSGFPVLENGGFSLPAYSYRSFPTPTAHWSGRVWARTACTNSNNRLVCVTGDCGGRLECGGAGGAPPATLAQLDLHLGGADYFSYGVSVVDGYNVPMSVTPHEGKGNCPVVGCNADLIPTCPASLQYRGPAGNVMGCKSGCQAFGTDDLCCRNQYNSPQTCKSSSYSNFFKQACPSTFTFAHDTPSLMHECSSPRELKVIFCP